MSRQSSLVIVTSATRPKSPSFTSSSLFMPASSSNTWAAQHSTIYHHSIIDPGRQHCNLSAAAWLQSYTRVVPQVSFKMSSFFSFHIMKNPKGTYCSNTHPFNSLSSRTTRVSRYQKGKTDLNFTEARDIEWQWHQLGHMQVCTSLHTDNHTSNPPLSFFTSRMPFLPPNQQRQSTEGVCPNANAFNIT